MKPLARTWKAAWRDTWLLFGQFRKPLTIFALTVLGGGALYYAIAQRVGEPVRGLSEAVYLVLTMSFLQPVGGFPHHPLLQAFYFIMPLVGIGVLAQGLAVFGNPEHVHALIHDCQR